MSEAVRDRPVGDPRVVVLVLNYNAGPPLGDCLKSLLDTTYPRTRIVVLDNGSKDGSISHARDLGLEIREYGENLGYTGGYNRGLREFARQADFLLLSNPDVVVPPQTIEALVATATADGAVGFVGPIQRHQDTKDVRSAGIRWRCGRLPEHVTHPGDPYDALEGAFILVRPAIIDRVGGLDEGLFLNLEDVDWQFRAKAAGFRVQLVPSAEILHRRPSSARAHTGAYYQTRNVCALTARYCGPAALRRVRMRLRAEGLAGRILGKPRAPYILEGLRDYRRGITGRKEFVG